MDLGALMADICDHYCKYPYELNEQQLTDRCEVCPLNKIEEVIKIDGKPKEI